MTNLAKTAMLVSLSIVNGGLLGERRDKKASALVEDTYGIAHRRAHAMKFLIDRKHKAVRRVIAASQHAREVYYRYTMPWGDENLRLLAVKTATEFKAKLSNALNELADARAEYIIAYPALVSASERDLGELFDRSQYPPAVRLLDLFTSKVTYWPIPESNHFIAEISNAAAEEAKANIEAEIEQRLLDATYDMVTRAKKVVTAYVDKLEKTSVDDEGKPKGIIRDSLTDNLRDTADLIEQMNLTENLQIKKVVKDLRRLAGYSSRWLRRSGTRFVGLKNNALKVASEIQMNLTMLDLKDQEVADMVSDAGAYDF